MKLETFGWPVEYEIEMDPEFPGNGVWIEPTYAFDDMGRREDLADGERSFSCVVRFITSKGNWIGFFRLTSIYGIAGLFATPNPHVVCVSEEGETSLIDVSEPTSSVFLLYETRRLIPNGDQLLVVNTQSVKAVGPSGLQWFAQGLSNDGLEVERADDAGIYCKVDDYTGSFDVRLDAKTGVVLSRMRTGPRQDSSFDRARRWLGKKRFGRL